MQSSHQISHVNGIYSMPMRVYNHHIDSGRVVFVANYLKFMEAARTEWLRHLGIHLRELERSQRIAFVVRDLNVRYLKPASLDDLLTCNVRIEELNRSSLILEQTISRGGSKLCEAKITAVCVDVAKFRAVKIPADINRIFQRDLDSQQFTSIKAA
jgi:acyl-CoA thioester hydrolase